MYWLVGVVGVWMKNRRTVSRFILIQSIKCISVGLRIFINPENNSQSMSAGIPGGFPFTTAARMRSKVDTKIVQGFLRLYFIFRIGRSPKLVAPRPGTNEILNSFGD